MDDAAQSIVDGSDSIDELIASRRAQLETLRARNRAMMENLITASPSLSEDVRSVLTELDKVPNSDPAPRPPDVERVYLHALMEHSRQVAASLEALKTSHHQIEAHLSLKLTLLSVAWLLVFLLFLLVNGHTIATRLQPYLSS